MIKNFFKFYQLLKSILINIIPEKNIVGLRKLLPISISSDKLFQSFIRQWKNERNTIPFISSSLPKGINLVGYFKVVKGIGEAARSSARCLEIAQIPFTIVDFNFGIPPSQQVLTSPSTNYGRKFKFNTNLFHINPPQLPYLRGIYNRSELAGRYNIGVWYWELPVFPEDWRFAFELVDEVWVATQFVYDSISRYSGVPVIKIPPCVKPEFDPQLRRADFNLPDDRFLFMCAYDVLSVQARKNPQGAVEAFKRAFSKTNAHVGLVIKITNPNENPQEVNFLKKQIEGYNNCFLVEDVVDKTKFNSLLNLVDAYVSLHRSEGFGLIPAEAMSLGKPVIMTQWSGNLDFMTPENSCGVHYNLIPIKEQSGPYTIGQYWADPDIDHASMYMQKLMKERDYYVRISKKAKETIQKLYSPQHICSLIKTRMKEIGLISDKV